MSEANYNGKQPNNSSYIKNFVYGVPSNLWKVINYKKINGASENVITPSSNNYTSLYIPGNLFVDGNITNPSDVILKKNIKCLNIETTEKIMSLNPSSFEFKDDPSGHIHYGFIAGELEKEYPELIYIKPDKKNSKIKSVNYLEIIPLLVHKIQLMQKEIDDLKGKINSAC